MKSCRGFYQGLLLALLLISSQLTAAALILPDEPQLNRLGSRYWRFPVSWELMRSGFNALDVALEAENYSEYWAIIYLSPDEIELLTPRGRAPVVGIRRDAATPAGYPDLIIINEVDFGRLLGLDPDPAASLEKIIFIELPRQDGNEQNFALKASPKYFVSVQLTMSF